MSAKPIGFPCRKCKRPVCSAVCPRCLHDNRDWISSIKRMYERASSLHKGVSSEFRTYAPRAVVPAQRERRRPHWRKRMRWHEHDRCSDRGIIPPKLPEGFNPKVNLIVGDSATELRKLPVDTINCCVTSPPYFQLRDYGVRNDLGLLSTIEKYVSAMLAVFRQVKRVLADDGLLFLEIGDTYAGSGHSRTEVRKELKCCRKPGQVVGVPRKGKCLIPERLAIALADDGWICRAEIIVEKTNTKPEPKNIDRPPVSASPTVYMFAKQEKYYYRPLLDDNGVPQPNIWRVYNGDNLGCGRHPAPMPLPITQNCIQMGCRPGGCVLDPFCGSGQVGAAALEQGCHFVGIDASAKYIEAICVPRLVERVRRDPK